MDSGAFPLKSEYPVAIVGAGPVGLTTALALSYFEIPFVVFETNAGLSTETKAGTTLIRTLEVWQRFGAADRILSKAMRVDEIGDIERATNRKRDAVKLHLLRDETRFPFVINLPQSDMEPALRDSLASSKFGKIHHRHRLTGFTQHAGHVTLELDTPDGQKTFDASFLLACDGGRSTVRERLGVSVEGRSLPERFALVDLKVDLDVENPRDFPYLGYFSDSKEWMILVRQPECWRFLYPVFEGQREFTDDELLEKAMTFIGGAKNAELVGTNLFKIYHRVASKWHHGRVVLLGDAAHLITPMWALGLNTGILDANNLAWRIAWIMRGWASQTLLDGFESEQKPVAEQGSGEMAEAGRAYMASRIADVKAMSGHAWGNAYTRSLLGVRLGLNGTGDWSMVKPFAEPPPVVVGDRAPDGVVHDSAGHETRLHDLFGQSFVALYFTDVRRRPDIPARDLPWLRHYAVSRWDAPRDSAIRNRALLDSGDRVTQRYGCKPDTMVLVRPDDHIAAIEPMTSSSSRNGLSDRAEAAATAGGAGMTISVSYKFDDAVVLITGAGSGIGAALTRHCAREGASVIAIDRGHDNLLRGLDPSLRNKIDLRQVDVSDEAAVTRLLDEVRRKYPRLDAAVLAAAIQVRTNLDDMTANEWRKVIDTNLNGVFYCLHAIIPLMKAQRSGAIVAFTSGLALTGWPGAGAYAASKAALIGMIKSTAQELRNYNVRANVLSPGVRATPIFMDVSTETEREHYRNSIGIGEPEGVIPTLLYLISDASANLTGAVLEHRFTPVNEQTQ